MLLFLSSQVQVCFHPITHADDKMSNCLPPYAIVIPFPKNARALLFAAGAKQIYTIQPAAHSAYAYAGRRNANAVL